MALEIEELRKDFGGVYALQGVSFSIKPGEIVGLIGTNGAGKTTCFNVITGFIKPTGGSVKVDGKDITGKPSYELARLGVIRTFQHTSLFGKLTSFENVLIGLHGVRRPSVLDVLFATPKYRRSEKETHRLAEEILTKFKLMNKAWQQADELSYGEQRRLAIALAMISRPKYLLLDEPAAGLNSQETNDLASILIELKRENLGILLVEHDMSMVMKLCDHIVVLASGKLLAKGSPKEIRANSKVVELYLGAGVQHAQSR